MEKFGIIPKWISVEEDLPKNASDVWALCDTFLEDSVKKRCDPVVAYYYQDEWTIYDAVYAGHEGDITYWMPILALLKEKP